MQRAVKKHIIHCSDTPDTLDIGAAEIRGWHTAKPPKGNGWSDIGYHFVIRRDGTVEGGRPLARIGAHCAGHNADSVGTCLVGRRAFTEKQFAALRMIHDGLCQQFPGLSFYGHRDLDRHGKTCPNFEVKDVLNKQEGTTDADHSPQPA
jgi:N-acetylmuramoyl-L-alanine amidase